MTGCTVNKQTILTIVKARSGFVWLFPTKGQGSTDALPHVQTVFLEIGALVEIYALTKVEHFSVKLSVTYARHLRSDG
jgi:hypothetical protein